MRLRRVILENYRRHRRTEIEIPDGVTAVVGSNGAGKSSLLEAIAFALYGPRATRTPQGKQLLRSSDAAPGENVRVTLEFELANQAWAITRELRGKTQAPQATVTIDGQTQVQPTAGSSEEATRFVERALGLDRDGFYQTVVAQQGELDRLARMKPAERRSFILGMVGIGAVDSAIQRARDRRNQLRAQLDEATRALGDRALLQQARDQAEAGGAKAVAEREAAMQSAVAAELAAAQHVQTVEALRVRAVQRTQAEADATAAAQASRQADLAVQQASYAASQATVAQQRVAVATPKAETLPALEAESLRRMADREVAAQRNAMLARVEALRRQLLAAEAILTGLLASTSTTAGIPTANPTDLVTAQATLAVAETDAGRAADARALAIAHAAAARERATAAASRRDRVRRLGTVDDAGVACPTCEQTVTGDHLAHVRTSVEAELAKAGTDAAAATKALQDAEAKADAAARGVLAARRALETAAEHARRVTTAQARVAELQTQLTTAAGDVPTGPARPPADPTGTEGPLTDDALRSALAAARAARDDVLRHAALAARVPELEAAVLAAQGAATTCHASSDASAAAFATLPDVRPELVAAEAALREANRRVVLLREAVLAASLAAQAAEHRLAQAVAALERDAASRARASELARNVATWTALVGTAGDGVLDRFKDHLVARTAPLVQEEASRLLGLFTQGRYVDVVLDEDYEVYVRDGGTNYTIDRFSGGEQDLIHLALRLAISRLLATRADGAEIRFLALDEVFGSLDQQHRATVVGALQQLGGLYSQVLAVTHHEDLQQMLDHAIHVRLDGEAAVVDVDAA